jgi:hypothetical protein
MDYMQSPHPFDVATCMYYTGIDPFTKNPFHVAGGLHDRKLQRALIQFFKPANWFTVREALFEAGRADLIGDGCDALIPARPPNEALVARRKDANTALKADYYHAIRTPMKQKAPAANRGYRPGRVSQRRRAKPGRGSGTIG